MATYDVNIYQSQALRDWCSDNGYDDMRAATNVADALEAVFDESSEHDVNATAVRATIEIPTYQLKVDGSYETVDQRLKQNLDRWPKIYVGSATRLPYSAPHPEYGDDTFEMYDHGRIWWEEYAEHNLASAEGAHSNLLLSSTDASSGGLASPTTIPFAVAHTGRLCAGWEGDLTGNSDAVDAIQTTVHEVGHNLLEYNPLDEDTECGSSGQHDMGDIEEQESCYFFCWTDYYETPMSNATYNDCMFPENYCGHDVPDASLDGASLRFSDCALEHLADPSYWD